MTASRDDYEVTPPWQLHDCECLEKRPSTAPAGCAVCDGHGFYFWNEDDGQIVSPMIVDAVDRHG